MTFSRIKRLIESGRYNKETLTNQIDVFLLAGRITTEEYNTLIDMMA